MLRRRRRSTPTSCAVVSGALALALGGVLAACGSDDGAPAASGMGSSDPAGSAAAQCVAHTNPPLEALAAPPATFETDLAPILARSCAFASCHGSKGPGNHGLFLGTKSADDVDSAKAALAAPSRALPSMPYVTPGDPDRSFLLHKLDGDLCAFEEQCVSGSCGTSMPAGNALLAEASRDAIRRWIAQGAK